MSNKKDSIGEEKILDVLNKIKDILTAIAKNQLSEIVKKEIIDSNDIKLYNLTGENKIVELSKKLKMSLGAISNRWKKWESLGLLIKEGKRYRKVL
jgi:DNA replication initiation complex subunit (GINS family)